MIRTKCVHSPVEPAEDGLRILAARFRDRGMPTTRYDVWMPNLGPSERLLKEFLSKRMSWTEFSRGYLKELMEGGSIDHRNVTIKNHGQKFTLRLLQKLGERGNITLLCHCAEDEPHCHRHLLKKKLDGRI
jgi:uncharacterized protein YeaO (DUF488 family)